MLRPFLKKSVHEAKWLLAACSLAVACFCWLRVWIVSRVDTGRFKEILDLLPGDWQRFTPVDFGWLVTYAGRISLAYDELIVVLCVSIWAISRGSDCVSGEINRGTMEMLLGQPLSRLKLLGTNASINVGGVIVLAFAAWFGNYLGIQTTTIEEKVATTIPLPFHLPLIGSELPIPFGESKTQFVSMTEKIDAAILIPASINLAALGIMLAGFSTLMSSWDRYRWRTIGIVVGIFIIQIMVKLAGMAAEEWEWILYLSIFTAYEPELMVRLADQAPETLWQWQMQTGSGLEFGPMAYHAVMVVVGTVSYAIAAVIFCRRDIPAPL